MKSTFALSKSPTSAFFSAEYFPLFSEDQSGVVFSKMQHQRLIFFLFSHEKYFLPFQGSTRHLQMAHLHTRAWKLFSS